MRFCVYQLRASDEIDPFYVGKTFEGSKRLVEHRYSARTHNRMVCAKIKSVVSRGGQVLLEPIVWTDTEHQVKQEEIRLIAQHGRRDNGTGMLCNHTNGGEGVRGYKHTTRAKQAMSAAKRGNRINVGRKRLDFAALFEKPITVFLVDGTRVSNFGSSKEASMYTGVNKASISDCLRGKTQTAKSRTTGVVYQFKSGDVEQDIDAVSYRQRAGLGPVAQYTTDGKLIGTYRNSKHAEKETGIKGTSIRSCIHKTAKTAGGFVWCLADQSNG